MSSGSFRSPGPVAPRVCSRSGRAFAQGRHGDGNVRGAHVLASGQRGQALYFSRSVIPYLRGAKEGWARQHSYLKHIGLYAFRTKILPQLQQLPDSPLELAESLEQLRWLDAGYRIQVQYTELGTVGIDTPEDLEELSALILERGHTQD